MRTNTVACVILTSVVSISATLPLAGAPAPPDAARTKWEYKSFNGIKEDVTQLDQLGADGWELVGVTANNTTNVSSFYLKRAK
jgi:hypothetical protein